MQKTLFVGSLLIAAFGFLVAAAAVAGVQIPTITPLGGTWTKNNGYDPVSTFNFSGEGSFTGAVVLNSNGTFSSASGTWLGGGTAWDQLPYVFNWNNGAGLEKGRDFGPVVGRGKGLASGRGGLIA